MNWRTAELTIRGNAGRVDVLPLAADVGAAMADYLLHARPAATARTLFVTLKAPLAGLPTSSVTRGGGSRLRRRQRVPGHTGDAVTKPEPKPATTDDVKPSINMLRQRTRTGSTSIYTTNPGPPYQEGSISVPNLPTPEDLWTRLLIFFFGPGATIVVVYGLLMWVLSWKTAAQTSIKVGKYSASVAGQALKLPPVALGFALLTSAVMLATQALWLWTCYVVGNGWSYLIHPPGKISDAGPEWDRVFGSLHWDTVSKVYVGACLLALLLCYVAAARGWKFTGIATLLLAPTGLVAVVAVIPTVLLLLFALLRWIVERAFVLPPYGKGMLLLSGLALTHIISSLVALSMPGKMSGVWTRR